MKDFIYYHKVKRGFVLNSDGDDTIGLTKEEYNNLLSEQSLGRRIVNDSDVVVSKLVNKDLVNIERSWRDAELQRSDIELNKVQDSDPKAFGVVADWRVYRKQLRAWPEHQEFPNKQFRPVPPDLKE